MNTITPALTKVYKPYLVSYMSYLHQVTTYTKNSVFDNDELCAATPETIYKWMCMKTYGIPQLVDDDHLPPAKCRSSTLEMCKKALSHFMPHSTASWNTQSLFGNPTKSKVINSFIKSVKKRETRRVGKGSSAKRPITQTEFRAALKILSTNLSFQCRYRLTCMMKFQYHLITRSDDLGHFKTHDLKSHKDSMYRSFCLEVRVFWSKNVLEERDCPNQIILGSMDSTYCLLLSLSIYLETWMRGAGQNSVFLFSDDVDERNAPKKPKILIHLIFDKTFLQIMSSIILLILRKTTTLEVIH